MEDFRTYIEAGHIDDSNDWVAIRTLFIFADKNGSMSLQKFSEHYLRYYQKRSDAGLLVDNEGSIAERLQQSFSCECGNLLAKAVTKQLEIKGFIKFFKVDAQELITFSEKIWKTLTASEKVKYLAVIEEKLEHYFTHKVPHPDNALAVPCVFCDRKRLHIVKENQNAFTLFDIFPAVAGHCLIIPKRHVRDVFRLSPQEIGDMLELLKEMKVILDQRYEPDGYNVGFNVGYAAGQTVMHAHMHCFPRKWGDVENPRGGMRNIIPNWFEYAGV